LVSFAAFLRAFRRPLFLCHQEGNKESSGNCKKSKEAARTSAATTIATPIFTEIIPF
jgi:hypothetical protein